MVLISILLCCYAVYLLGSLSGEGFEAQDCVEPGTLALWKDDVRENLDNSRSVTYDNVVEESYAVTNGLHLCVSFDFRRVFSGSSISSSISRITVHEKATSGNTDCFPERGETGL